MMEKMPREIEVILLVICMAIGILLVTHDKLFKMLRRYRKSNKPK